MNLQKRHLLISVCLTLLCFGSSALCEWQPVKGRIMTKWAEDVSASNPLPEYPRPQLVRDQWINLNGLWSYSMTASTANKSGDFSAKILVPYPIESALSGVRKIFTPKDKLWYSRHFKSPANLNGKKVILHFGGVDYESKVWINGKEAGSHKGGYDAFSFDITELLVEGENEILVSVLWLDPVK
ncbi:MAG: hypothetical protein HQL32_00660 [Planctomycetes bacterium]|nr:hypothetical protein [Planctomycetota bacterium]